MFKFINITFERHNFVSKVIMKFTIIIFLIKIKKIIAINWIYKATISKKEITKFFDDDKITLSDKYI